jgi:excisionase family DNA binding protein
MSIKTEGTGTAVLFPNEFGNLITQALLHLNQNFEICVKNAVKSIVEELKQDLTHQKEEEIESGFITRSQAIKFLNISPPTLYRYQKTGLLPYHKVGRKIYFNKRDLVNATKIVFKQKGGKQ